jgi:hypothetical protein
MAQKLLGIGGEGFQIRETDHFTICYDTGYDALRPLLARLEGTYNTVRRFCEGIGLGAEAPSERFGVLLFDSHEDFAVYAEEHGLNAATAAGFYNPRTNLAAFGNTLNTPQLREVNVEIDRAQEELKRLRKSGTEASRARRAELRRRTRALQTRRDALVERFNRFVLQHEAAHQMLFNMGVHSRRADNPQWLMEGLACQFEVPESRAARGLGRVNHTRLADLRDALGISLDARQISPEQLARAFASQRLVPLADFLSDQELFTRRDANVSYRYAQAWGLVYYLARKHHDPFAAYVRQLASRAPGAALTADAEIDRFETHFGPLDGSFTRAWVDYMAKLRLDRTEAGR